MAKETAPKRLRDAENVLASTAEHLQQEADHQREVLEDREMCSDDPRTAVTLEQRGAREAR